MVTADGEVLRVDAESHPDLFWAIRGGGGNFGVATRLKLRLHELTGDPRAGMLVLRGPRGDRGLLAGGGGRPEELSTIVNVMPAPPLPFVPPEGHGELIVMAMIAYAGPPLEGERAIAPFRALAEPIADMVRPMPYPDLFPQHPADFHPVTASRTMFLDGIDRSAARRSWSTSRAHLAHGRDPAAGARRRPWRGCPWTPPPTPTATGG